MTERNIIDNQLQPGLSELKLHLRITSSDQDALLLSYLKAAAVAAEHHIGRCLEPSKFHFTGRFTSVVSLESINLRHYPLQGVPQVKVDGQPVTDFTVEGRKLIFGEGVEGEVVEVDYQGGGLRVEPDIRTAILLTAAKFFNNPVDSVETLPSVASNLLGQYRTWHHEDGDQD